MKTNECLIAGCNCEAIARGLCPQHYAAARYTGELDRYPTVRDQPRPPCLVEECDRPAASRGWCRAHYLRWRRRGSTDPLPYDRSAALARFAARIDRREVDECWPWMGTVLRNGYGQVCIFGRRQSAHRVAHELFVGPIPGGYVVDHVWSRGCRRRDCVNPFHLEAVTASENTRRAANSARYLPGPAWTGGRRKDVA